jgi:hypothetical protein
MSLYGTIEMLPPHIPPQSYSKTNAFIIAGQMFFLFSTMMSVYCLVYINCNIADEKSYILTTGIISIILSIGLLMIYWKYRHDETSQRLIREQYVTFLFDCLVTSGIVIFSFVIEDNLCYAWYFHMVKGLYIMRLVFSVVNLSIVSYTWYQFHRQAVADLEEYERRSVSDPLISV